MSSRWNKNMVYGFITIIIITSIFGVYLFVALGNSLSNYDQPFYLAIDSTTFNPTAAQVSTSTGLETSLTLNATSILPGQWISLTISESNSMKTTNNVSASNSWPIQYLSLGACSENYPVGIGIFEGYYTLANVTSISEAQMVHFIHPGTYSCPEIFHIDSYVFQPSGNLVNYSNLCTGPGSPGCLIPMTGTIQLNGSWSGGDQFGKGAIDNILNPGIYTVVGADEWGQIVLLHFAVTNVKVVSVTGPISPYNPAGPVIGITLMNVAEMPIISLNTSLRLESQLSLAISYSFIFSVSASNPLLPGQSVKDIQTLIGGGFDSSQSYHLIIAGTFENGMEFSYIQPVQIIPPG